MHQGLRCQQLQPLQHEPHLQVENGMHQKRRWPWNYGNYGDRQQTHQKQRGTHNIHDNLGSRQLNKKENKSMMRNTFALILNFVIITLTKNDCHHFGTNCI